MRRFSDSYDAGMFEKKKMGDEVLSKECQERKEVLRKARCRVRG